MTVIKLLLKQFLYLWKKLSERKSLTLFTKYDKYNVNQSHHDRIIKEMYIMYLKILGNITCKKHTFICFHFNIYAKKDIEENGEFDLLFLIFYKVSIQNKFIEILFIEIYYKCLTVSYIFFEVFSTRIEMYHNILHKLTLVLKVLSHVYCAMLFILTFLLKLFSFVR